MDSRPEDDGGPAYRELDGKGMAADHLVKNEPIVEENPSGKPIALKKFSHGFWSPEFKKHRQITFKMLTAFSCIILLVIWLCLPLYWGSLWKANKYTDKLTVRVIDHDGGFIGKGVSDYLLAQRHKGGLGYFYTPPSELPDLAAVEHDIWQEGAWAAVVISPGASDRLASARATADPSYNGSLAIDIVFAQARNELATGTYLLPLLQTHLSSIPAKLSAERVANFLASGGNATALAAAPQTLSHPIGYVIRNVRPYNQPVATAITLVGLIYLTIFALITTMANNGVREVIGPYLTIWSYMAYRICAPLFIYLVISFFYAMVDLAFKIDFGAHFTYAGGFFLWWFILFLVMAAVGLVIELAITLLTPRFVGFIMVPLIIVNVSGVSLPHELQPWIFRYSVAMPYYNASRSVRTIMFDTKNDIGQNCGILIAWIVVNIFNVCLVTYIYRWRDVKVLKKAEEEKARAGERAA